MIRMCVSSSCFKPDRCPQAGPLPSLSPSLAMKLGVSSFFKTRAGGRATVLLSANRPRFWAEREQRKVSPSALWWLAPWLTPRQVTASQSVAHVPRRPGQG